MRNIRLKLTNMWAGCLILALLLSVGDCRMVRTSLSMSKLKENKVVFLTHFSMGTGHNNMTFRYKKSGVDNTQLTDFKIGMLLDENYQAYKLAQSCRQKEQLFHQVERIRFYDAMSGAQYINMLKINKEQVWYFFAIKCENLEFKTPDGSESLDLEMSIMRDGSHLGLDEYIVWPYIIIFGAWIAILSKNLFMLMLKAAMKFTTEPAQLLLYSGYISIGLSLFYKMVNLVTESYSGETIVFFDILHGVLKNLAEGLMLTVLIAVSWGWSIFQRRISNKVKIVSLVVTMVNVVNVAMWHWSDEAEDTYHQYEQLPGVISFVLRVGLGFVFVLGCITTSNQLVGKKRFFIDRYGLFGSIYLFSWPVAVVICELLLPPHMHNSVIGLTEQIVHLATNSYICWMFANPDSEYKRINIKKYQDDDLPDIIKK